jgi:hypothetical protein
VKPPVDLDPDMRTILEIIQHAGEILSRLPLSTVRGYLDAAMHHPSEHLTWQGKALETVLKAEMFELANAELSAEEARSVPISRNPVNYYPDDALPS